MYFFLKYRSDFHEPYKIISWNKNKELETKIDSSSKKYVLYNSERQDIDDEGGLIYSPFFVGTIDKGHIDLNKKSATYDFYVAVFNSLEEIRDFKKTTFWNDFEDKGFCKIRRVFIADKENEEFVNDIFSLKTLKLDISKCGHSLLEILAFVSEKDAKLKEVLKSKKEIKRLIESGAVKIIKDGTWIKKENPDEYFISQEELIFKIGKTTFFKIK